MSLCCLSASAEEVARGGGAAAAGAGGRRRGGGHLALVWCCPHWRPYIPTVIAVGLVIAIGMLKVSGEPKWGVPQEKGSSMGMAPG